VVQSAVRLGIFKKRIPACVTIGPLKKRSSTSEITTTSDWRIV
jgi:hypothetical protein